MEIKQMTSPINTAYSLVKILSDKKQRSIRQLAAELNVNKSTIQKHVSEMYILGLIDVTSGKYGGVKWIWD